jgi:hypothetical protein
MRRAIVVGVLIGTIVAGIGGSASAAGTWTWPVRGPIIRAFDPPASTYGAGHRGIDIAVPVGTVVVAPVAGVVSFAGRVAGQLFVSIDHGAGVVSTSSYLSAALVAKDDPVAEGQPIGLTGAGHPGSATAHLHFGVRLGGVYVDPLAYLGPISLVGIVRLAPIGASGPSLPTGDPIGEVGPAPGTPWMASRLDGDAGPIAGLAGVRPSRTRGRPVAA